MEKSEPSLVPGWLRNTGSVTGGDSSASRTSHSDVTSCNHWRNRTSKSMSPLDNQLPTFLDRSSSSNSCWVSGSGSGAHAYSSFNRRLRDVSREKVKEKSGFTDHLDHHCEPLGTIIPSRTEKALRRSHSLVSRKKSELFPPRIALDSKGNVDGYYNNTNARHFGSSTGSSIKKAVFDKDFPSLGSEEKLDFPELRRIPSPGLNSAVQSLPVNNSGLVGGEGWTSALAEVPTINGGNSMGSSFVQQTVAVSSRLGPAAAGLNMAEALAQVPSRCRPHPEIDEVIAKTQKLEELAIKQSRQLIPVTPVTTKALVPNSSDKLKPKAPTRTGETNAVAKNEQQLPSMTQHANHSFCSGQVKSGSPKSSHGKFHVLKPVWENGVSPTRKESPTSTASSKGSSSQLTFSPSVASTALKSPNHADHSSVERKSAGLDLKSGLPTEKRLTQAQVKSRNDFFNLLKKKTSTALPSSDPIISSLTEMKSGEVTNEAVSYPASSVTVENRGEVTNNDDGNEEAQMSSCVREKSFFPNEVVGPDEEEAAFLRSLGWEENSGEDDGLTEEEISAFYQEYMKVKPSLKVCRGVLCPTSLTEVERRLNSTESRF